MTIERDEVAWKRTDTKEIVELQKTIFTLREEIEKMKEEFNDVYLPMHSERIQKRDDLLKKAKKDYYDQVTQTHEHVKQWLKEFGELK